MKPASTDSTFSDLATEIGEVPAGTAEASKNSTRPWMEGAR